MRKYRYRAVNPHGDNLLRRNAYLYQMRLTVVNKGNSLIALLNTVNDHTLRAVVAHLPDSDMVDGFPVPIVHRECIPFCG